jgi:membrane-associated phospholipid phosphatase
LVISFIINSLTQHTSKHLVFTVAFLLLSSYSFGYNLTDSLTNLPPKRSYFGSYLSDAGYLYTAPIRWKGKDWAKLGILSGLGLALYSADDNIQRWMTKSKTQRSENLATVFEKFGNTGSTSIGLGVAFIAGVIVKNEKAQRISLLSLKSSLLSGLLAQTLKNLGHRSRPNAGLGQNSWHGPKIGGKHKAFPSGHTTTAFAIATTFAQIYKEKKWVAISVYSIAAMTGISRIHDNKHWATDVFAGAALGYFSAKAILKNEGRNRRSITLAPSSQYGSMGLTMFIPMTGK